MRIRTHPGEVLNEEFLKPLGVTAHALAVALGVPATRIADIVHQRRGVSADTAARLARFFGTSAAFWMNLQSAYDLSIVERDKGADLSHIRPHASVGTSLSC
ncbi:HigA family addiction module antitoxin [Nitratidesulfovibrio vulgaris]|uniref:DNA-binding protein n=1 Tax=Nitratidesulfovibrio vulgaris (strain ATCC 29579 / DSM 644 / CCUG 34227 / NCIMB 8303 / VKM B-1760 / Hildenborough) TaxID=882 RepID=Q72BA6_NITV2|nr:HigA family addiction module antitoxin [Nitratidesulfovibrio vulgaris]AAS96207.1 DNA-binding protein [Nitratidesulfovibrio vulgaris str. Hildenborough]ADP86721.1 plasmid maintenance system antidote protein, XRE family [Nitratidesulfovibrio vulgaris RCH1]WCB45264.1 HigA family addiction module antitoxin [Nitratidesulfovibrio vulgaris]